MWWIHWILIKAWGIVDSINKRIMSFFYRGTHNHSLVHNQTLVLVWVLFIGLSNNFLTWDRNWLWSLMRQYISIQWISSEFHYSLILLCILHYPSLALLYKVYEVGHCYWCHMCMFISFHDINFLLSLNMFRVTGRLHILIAWLLF